MTGTDFIITLSLGFLMGISLVPILYFVVWQPLGKVRRSIHLHIQTADDLERAVRSEIDRRWRDLEGERQLRIINLELQERMTRERGPASQKRP